MWGFCWAEDELNIEFVVGHFFSAYLFPGEVDLFVSPNKVSAPIANRLTRSIATDTKNYHNHSGAGRP